jgi:hypothetical protein
MIYTPCLIFHCSLPTSGDGRGNVGRGPSIPLAGRTARPTEPEVADRIEEYASLGTEEFILSGYPRLEEALLDARHPGGVVGCVMPDAERLQQELLRPHPGRDVELVRDQPHSAMTRD